MHPRSYVPLVFVLLLTTGCANPFAAQKGSRVTTYNPDGTVAATTEEVAIGDKYTAYQAAVERTATAYAQSDAEAIKAVARASASGPNDSDIVSLAKANMAAMSIALIKVTSKIDQAVANIKYGKDGYDVLDTATHGFFSAVPVVAMGLTAADIAKTGMQTAGDRTAVTTTGDGNTATTEISKTSLISNPSSIATGNGAASSSATPSASTKSPPDYSVTNMLPAETPVETPAP